MLKTSLRWLALAILSNALIGCAGGGGSGAGGDVVTPPSAPPPPPPPNTSLLDLTSSEDFTNVSATGNASYSISGGQAASGSLSSTTLHYDVDQNSYTLSTNGRSQTFEQSDYSAADSSDAVAAYIKQNGSITDSLTLTRSGTSGRFTYEYVGGAYWQRTDENSTSIAGSVDALAYGIETEDGSLPRSGTAEYSVDLLGVQVDHSSVFGIVGNGIAQVDFARGVVATHGFVENPAVGDGSFSSEARISSSSNFFSGTFRYEDFGYFNGELQGQFFGPGAQEFGAAFSATSGSDRVVVGTLIGRGAAVSNANTSLASLAANEFFTADAVKLTANLPGSSGTYDGSTGFSEANAGSDALVVNYDASSRAYTLIASDQSQYFDGDVNHGFISERLTVTTPSGLLSGLRYVATGEWFFEKREGLASYRVEPFVYGILTPASAMPRTGTGDYLVELSGKAADDAFVNFALLSGTGFLNADFLAGTLSINGQVQYTEDYIISGRPKGVATGAFSGSGQISSSDSSFSGDFALTGLGPYSGAMNGHFFGPDAGEVGVSFYATDGSDGVVAGTLAGRLDASASQDAPTLAELSDPTDFTFRFSHYAPLGTFNKDIVSVAYDPASGGYALSLTDTHLQGAPIVELGLDEAHRDASANDAAYDIYSVSLDGNPYTARVLRALDSNPVIVLRYTSLVSLFGDTQSSASLPSDRYYAVFGLETPSLRMPIGGTATYNGVATGVGSVRTNAYSGGSPPSVTTFYDLSGTTAMSVDFASGQFQSTLDLTGVDISSNAIMNFSTLNFTGDISGNTFSTHQNGATYAGAFFGPNAEEVGGTFAYSQSDSAGTLTDLQGAFVGAR